MTDMDICKTCTAHLETGADTTSCLYYQLAIGHGRTECIDYIEADSCRADRLEAENKKLKEALGFYANKDNWTSNDIHSWHSHGSTIKGCDDECFANKGRSGSDWRNGKLARQVLKELEQ